MNRTSLNLLHSERPKLHRVLAVLSAIGLNLNLQNLNLLPGRVAQSIEHLTHKSEVLGSIPGLAKYFHFSFR